MDRFFLLPILTILGLLSSTICLPIGNTGTDFLRNFLTGDLDLSEKKPTTPTPCTDENKGECRCARGGVQTYVFWPGDGSVQRCFDTYVPSSVSVPALVLTMHPKRAIRVSTTTRSGGSRVSQWWQKVC